MTKTDFALPDWVDVGATFYERTCDADGSRTDKWHVRAIVYGRAVCRRWTKGHGGSWHYEIKSAVFFSVFGGQYDLRTGADLSTD